MCSFIGVEFAFLGLEFLATYPIHYHFCNKLQAGQALVRGCSIHDSRLRCVTVHNSMGVLVENNVAFNNKGMRGECFGPVYAVWLTGRSGAFRGSIFFCLRGAFMPLKLQLAQMPRYATADV